jgi:hypothetical protein
MIYLRLTPQTCGSAKLPQSSLACHTQAAMIKIMGLLGQDTLIASTVFAFFQEHLYPSHCHQSICHISFHGYFTSYALFLVFIIVAFTWIYPEGEGMEAEGIKCSSSSYCLTKITKVRNKLLYIYIYIYIYIYCKGKL